MGILKFSYTFHELITSKIYCQEIAEFISLFACYRIGNIASIRVSTLGDKNSSPRVKALLVRITVMNNV